MLGLRIGRVLRRASAGAAALAMFLALGAQAAPGWTRADDRAQPMALPDGAFRVPVENVDGVILVTARARGLSGADTAGFFVLDTGAGALALDRALAIRLGIASPDSAREDVALAERALPRFEFGERQVDKLSPVLTLNAEVVRAVTDRPVLGLIGQPLFANQILQVDYRGEQVTVAPSAPGSHDASPVDRIGRSKLATRALIERNAHAVPFELAGDGKILVRARVGGARARVVTLVLDTGATKTVLFVDEGRPALEGRAPWRALCGLSAPTLFGTESACAVRVPEIRLLSPSGDLIVRASDAVELESPLRGLLSQVSGREIAGLLGYSALKRHRITLDFANRVAWFEPEPANWDDRENEYSHVGLQIERRSGAIEVVAVAIPSPAEAAGIRAGDLVVSVDGRSSAGADLFDVANALEGAPGSKVTLVLSRAGIERTYTLRRKRLL